jgi:hypothetical protein
LIPRSWLYGLHALLNALRLFEWNTKFTRSIFAPSAESGFYALICLKAPSQKRFFAQAY